MPLLSATAHSTRPLSRVTSAVFGVVPTVAIVRLPSAPTGAELGAWLRGAG